MTKKLTEAQKARRKRNQQKRKHALKRATPNGAGGGVKRAQKLNSKLRKDGMNTHLDHYYPLRGETVCGLNCLANLQIITAEKDAKKANNMPTEPIDHTLMVTIL